MKTVVCPQLAREAAHFRLRFACDDCVHFAPERDQTCGHGWPVRLRRSAIDAVNVCALDTGTVFFCKEFELA